jgi:glycosyltransferase involved in cell wall biosynthesis
MRRAGLALRWQFLDWVDRMLFAPPVERAALRSIAGPAYVGPTLPVSRVYIDVSVIYVSDAGTGIQRVVRSLCEHLPAALGPEVEHELMIVRDSREGYVSTTGAPLSGAPGSLFFGLDFATESIFRARHDPRRFKLAGGQIWFLVHDILPISHPQWFTPVSRLRYRRWLRVCAALADGILCVSPVVAAQVEGLLTQHYGRTNLPRIATIELGSDITAADLDLDVSELPVAAGLDVAKFKNAALVVGTLEPRKGHADALDAFDLIWAQGHEISLILIGRIGWNTEGLQARIRQHPQRGRLLFWLTDVDDHALHAAYRHSRLVIVPSLAEGYGLPLDEALAVGTPVLARDIPVFRRHDDVPVSYFAESADPASIAAAILAAHAAAAGPRRLAPLRYWNDTAGQVARELVRPS